MRRFLLYVAVLIAIGGYQAMAGESREHGGAAMVGVLPCNAKAVDSFPVRMEAQRYDTAQWSRYGCCSLQGSDARLSVVSESGNTLFTTNE